MQGVYIHGKEKTGSNCLHSVSAELVSLVDALGVPISPIKLILKDGQGKRVRQAWRTSTYK